MSEHPSPATQPRDWRALVRPRVAVLAVLLLAATVAGRFGAWWWLFDLASHFAVQFAVASAVVGGLALWAGGRPWAIVAAIALTVNVGVVAPVYAPRSATAGPRELQVMTFNVNAMNPNHDAVLQRIRDVRAHLVLVMEVTPEWLTALETLEDEYRVEVAEPRGDNFGIALLSRDIEVTAKLIRTADGLAFVEARTLGLTLLGVHPLPPIGAEYTASRNAALDLIASWRAEQTGSVVVMGDLNTTPFSPSFSRLTDADLVSSQRGFGLQTTWPQVPWFLAPARIPIDHLLHSPDVVTVRREVGDALGSDHRPLHVVLRLQQ